MTRPLIGMAGERMQGSRLRDSLPVLGGRRIDVFWTDYSDAILAAGGLPVMIPQDAPVEDLLDRLDGLLLPGGTDVDPSLYGAERHPDAMASEIERDALEVALLKASTARAMPVLGICRGIQMVNVHAGGTLHQHVPAHAHLDGSPEALVHTVTFREGSVLHGLYGPTREVNSLHHQTLDQLGTGLSATGTSDDGVVEAVEHNELPIVAVQWHPEMMATRATDPLFSWLVGAAEQFR